MMQQSWEVSAGEIQNVSEYVRLLTMRKIKEEKQICYYSSWEKKKKLFSNMQTCREQKVLSEYLREWMLLTKTKTFQEPQSLWLRGMAKPSSRNWPRTSVELVLKITTTAFSLWVFTEWSLLSYRDCSNWDGLNLSSWTSLVVIISCVF